jgi:3-methylcrotonyl-CoA carboxylase beta subunit
MKKLVNELNGITNTIINGGKSSEKIRQKHTSRGKLLVRDRIQNVLDPK